jgi:NitT/TauT family transport system substrate-binding protein
MRALLVLLALLATALAPATAETLKVAVGQKGFWDTSITAFGERKGFFREEGLDLELLYTEGGAETQQAVISGSVDIGIGAGTLGMLSAAVKGAPVRAIAAEWNGGTDTFWYARSDGPIHSLKDAAGKTAGFSTVGSSSNLALLELLRAAGVTARPTPTGGAGVTLTQVMSGQIDIGWAVPPIALAQIEAGELRIVARGSDIPGLADQTTRVNIANAALLRDHRAVVERFARAYRRSLDWAYRDPMAIAWFAEGLKVDPSLARRARDEFYPRAAMEPAPIRGLDVTLRQAVELKRVPPQTTIDQAKAMVDLVPGATP